MTIKKILFLGILLSITKLNAQTNFQPGYIIKESGDTLFGKINYLEDSLMAHLCIFRNQNDDEIRYTPNDIIAYRFIKGKYFITKKINGKKEFLEFLIKGALSVYYLKDSLGSHYFLEREDVGMTEYLFNIEIKQATEHKKKYILMFSQSENILIYTQSIYKMDSIDIFQNHPEYKAKIAKMGYLNHRKMVNLAVKYNKEIGKYKNYIVHEKEISKNRIIFEPAIGVVNYNKLEDYKDMNYFQKGLLVHFGILGTKKRFYFRTGILHSNLQQNISKSKDLFKIPAQFEYIYNKRIINPKFALGFNFYRPFYMSAAFMVGSNIKLNDAVNLGLTYDIDFIQGAGFPLPSILLSQSIAVGLQIEL